VQAKRTVLAILRVQPAKDLVESLMQPVSDEHEMMWEDILESEIESDHRLRHPRRMPSTVAQESAYRLEDIRSWVDCLVCESGTNFELACRSVR
jgi:Ras GTPase-activating-like protein IQGAP2/3